MRVLLHGATNLSNYGDYLFAELFYRALRARGIEAEFYGQKTFGISKYFAKHLHYTPADPNYKKNMKSCDALVYFSGGYFVEPTKPGLRSELRHIRRYLPPAEYFMKAGKPIYVLGVGAGPFTDAMFSRRAKKVLDYARVVTVRNEESAQYCKDFGVDREILVTADTALVIKEFMEKEKGNVPKFTLPDGQKLLILHVDTNQFVMEQIRDVFRPAVRNFLKQHPEYRLFLASDGVRKDTFYERYREMFADCNPLIEPYDDPWVLTRKIERADLILTTKLHMGIVGCAFGASVLSFPFVPQKTKRFYKQIGEADRCVSLREVTTEQISQMMETYRDRRIEVPAALTELAKQNLDLLPQNR